MSPAISMPVMVVAQVKPTPPAGEWWSLPSSQWTSDQRARQESFEFQREGLKDYGAKVGLPDYYRVYGDPWVVLSETRQKWLAEVLGLAWIGTPYSGMNKPQRQEFIYWWRQYLQDGRCFTNKAAWNTKDNPHADFIQGINLNAQPMQWENLLLAGNMVDVLSETTVTKTERYTGVQASYRHYRVRCVDSRKLPAPEKFLLDRYVCHIPTTIKPDGTTGVFPQFDGRAVTPLWQVGDCYVWDRLIKKA